MNSSRELFVKRLNQLNITLSDEQIGMFDEYYHILYEQNQYMNLTAITDYDDVLLKHYIDFHQLNYGVKFLLKNQELLLNFVLFQKFR